MNELIELNLRNNKIKVIEGLQNCGRLELLKVGQNDITDVKGIKMLDNLKTLKIKENPLNDCSEFHMMNRKHFNLIFSTPEEEAPQERKPTPSFYERYNAVIEHRLSSSSGSNEDSD